MKNLVTIMAVVTALTTMIYARPVLAAGDKAPEPGSWEFQAAQETGSLPAGYFGTDKAAKGSADQPAVVEVGGQSYRIGVDTP
ncbi:MAG: hypothetical protein ACM319_10215 [Deltaproteobacteria bacterium]|nr:hypothetical protein [Candidatus Deferrimicrobiaceae bacterium]